MRNKEFKIIGLTGPIAAGKDEVASILKRQGAVIIDVDKIAHTLYPVQSPIWGELVKTFSSKILKRGGEINRKKLGEIVFADKKNLQLLNRIVHPMLKDAVMRTVTSLQSPVASKEGERLETGDQGQTTGARRQVTVINAAALKEIGLIDLVDEVWVVLASKENRLKRLIRSGILKEDALKRISVQASQKDYLKIADVLIRNDGTVKQLNEKVRANLHV